jgi:dCMP deaminase
MTPRFLQYYMDIAERTAQMSYAKRLQVGAVIVRDNGILATGYNGTPTNHVNSCEIEMSDGTLITKPEVIHAEQNALVRCTERGLGTFGGTLLVTHSPCLQCSSMALNHGVKEVFYRHTYRSNDGINLLLSKGVNVTKI